MSSSQTSRPHRPGTLSGSMTPSTDRLSRGNPSAPPEAHCVAMLAHAQSRELLQLSRVSPRMWVLVRISSLALQSIVKRNMAGLVLKAAPFLAGKNEIVEVTEAATFGFENDAQIAEHV